MLERLAALQTRHPLAFIALGYAIALAFAPLVLQLGLNSAFVALLPEDKPSVKDLEAAQKRVGGLTTLTLAIQSDDRDALMRFAEELVPRLEKIENRKVRSVDWNIGTYENFVRSHKHLYADLEDLEEARIQLEERLDYERARANPFYVDLSDEPPPEPEELIERINEKAKQSEKKLEKFPGGFYIHPEDNVLCIFLRTDIETGDAGGAGALIQSVEKKILALEPSHYAEDLKVEYGGDLLSVREEHQAIANELILATTITIVLVLVSILVFFRYARAIPLLGLALAAPVTITFGIAELAVDYLNTSTAFLGSIVIGNGINPNIIWLARYFELRRQNLSPADSLKGAHLGSWAATLVASLAASAAYASLTLTDFRGFRDFGIIGGSGMVLCWLGAFTLLPPLTLVADRIRPMASRAAQRGRAAYAKPFARLATNNPRRVAWIALVAGVAGVLLIAYAIYKDPIEYNFRNLRSVRDVASRSQQVNKWASEIVGRSASGDGIAMLLPSREQARKTERELERARDEEDAPYGPVRSLLDLLPQHQEHKTELLADIRRLLLDVRRYADGEQQKRIDENLPPQEIEPLTVDDLPEQIARPYIERDGTRGRMIFIEQREGFSTWDGRYLVRWADSLRQVRTDDGERPPLAGRAPVFADMIEVIWEDGPKAIGLSFTATCLLLLVTFRLWYQRLLTLGALLLGIVWMAGTMALLGEKLNFLNFVAFPITFGNGVDYGVNVMRRFGLELRQGDTTQAITTAIRESGGAVTLCSLTTIIGYSSLYVSANRALNSFGLAMAISEITCLLAAVLVMPALLRLRSTSSTSSTS